MRGVEVRWGVAAIGVKPAQNYIAGGVLQSPGYKAANSNVNRCAILYADSPRNFVEPKAITVAVFSERIGAIADACAVVLGVEEWAYVSVLPADIYEHPPVCIITASCAI